MWLERGQGLCRRSQHCQTRRCLPQRVSPDWTHLPSFHDRDEQGHELGVVYRFRAGATVATNNLSGLPDCVRKDVCERLDQVCHPAFRIATRHHASFVRIVVHTYSLINLDILLKQRFRDMLPLPSHHANLQGHPPSTSSVPSTPSDVFLCSKNSRV